MRADHPQHRLAVPVGPPPVAAQQVPEPGQVLHRQRPVEPHLVRDQRHRLLRHPGRQRKLRQRSAGRQVQQGEPDHRDEQQQQQTLPETAQNEPRHHPILPRGSNASARTMLCQTASAQRRPLAWCEVAVRRAHRVAVDALGRNAPAPPALDGVVKPHHRPAWGQARSRAGLAHRDRRQPHPVHDEILRGMRNQAERPVL